VLACVSRILTFACHSVWTDSNQLSGSIPSELGELKALKHLSLSTWIGLSWWHQCHACSHFLAILSEQLSINSLVPFLANSENWRRWLICRSVRGLVCLSGINVALAHISLPLYLNRVEWTHGFHSERTRRTDVVDSPVALYVDWIAVLASMSRLLTFPYHSIWTGYNQLTGSIRSELGELTSLTLLNLCMWIGLSCLYEYAACSHFLAILFEQGIINSRVPFRANSKHFRRWLICISVCGFVCLVGMNVTLAHISLPFYLYRG
jgi:hypothetical protein